LQQLLRRLVAREVLPVLSVGNQTAGQPVPPFCPGNLPEALGVGASAPSGRVCATSPSGSFLAPDGSPYHKPDLVAPGEDIYTCEMGGGRGPHSGVSFAVPVVAGVAALYLEALPRPVADLREAILRDCALLADPPERQGSGLVQAPP
jgi:serine protease AprX